MRCKNWSLCFLSVCLVCALQAPVGAQGLADQALVVVKVPAGAEVYFGKTLAKATGTQRVWLTPPLARGKEFEYELTAVWKEGKETKTAKHLAIVRAGGRTEIDLTKATPEPATAEPVKKDEAKAAPAKDRDFIFNYEALITDVPQGKTARVWIPIPSDSVEQDVEIVKKDVPGKDTIGREKQYGNQILYFDAEPNKDGEIPVKLSFRVKRREVKTDAEAGQAIKPLASEKIARFLQADKMVPIGGKTLSIIDEVKLPAKQTAIGKVVYDAVNTHMKYDKSGTGWGRGDAYWACDNKYGNCTDFHSLFMSIVRAQKIPSKFEIGFPVPPERGAGKIGGYHCWAYFLPDNKGWVPVDISEANRNPDMRDYYFGNLTENRVTFSAGRDIDLVPQQDGPPLNFFVYPYVEIDGQAHPLEKITRTYTYQDVQK